ncbi:alpha-1,4-glucan--maltose-1-phosphate maltosyltransferase [Adhaeribacter sp. BT258]|uniref:Alpha-1,4-glucan:maltose-1-phosphate maltosyltransferase n=1 Tax=Adhaeribacter terrigena TaxID=2793070 RepID=A0ABS1C0R1_9BACT|nr:alpha-1,4-glucan--maltose-1-phosphate maltosyltransferase [Adhaeribacter terrigena]MBK0402991.1 alpha-1,4-glucan--maltose-1-phosphate maltosyltransferase [Adhaeribacter terrigena]
MKHLEGTKRVVIDNVKPEINGGHFPVKRVVGEKLVVEADVFTDGHDSVRAVIIFRQASKKNWQEKPMEFLGNDRWQGEFTPTAMGRYEYSIIGWVDHFLTWKLGLQKKFEAGQELSVEFQIGAEMLEAAAAHAKTGPAKKLQKWAAAFRQPHSPAAAVSLAESEELADLMYLYADRSNAKQYFLTLAVEVERQKALFSSWYEFFPRSTAEEPGKHGTFQDALKILPRIAEMGFDVIYLPPIHPIGISFRKGYNNTLNAEEGMPGVPWAIGGAEGGHKAIHPDLGTLEDFREFVKASNELGMEIALDFAIQCSPDHPYVKEHPDWFKWRPDGTVQYAENPPKKYQDVLPVNFETEDWENLWQELKSIVVYWIKQGVTIFRVDNPHTKPFVFWEWLIREVRNVYPNTIFLAEAFTRPRIMERLGKIGFNQSYTYFTWRNTAEELREYMEELTKTDLREFYRPNFWPNTPDILPEHLQLGGEPMFITRLVMAATMSSNYGLYGPVYEFGINTPLAPGKEEYLDSEKYEIKHWDWNAQTKIRDVITRLNQIRKENPALQTTWHIHFGKTDNSNLLCYGKLDETGENRLIMVINLDPFSKHNGWVEVPVKELLIDPDEPYHVQDLITGHMYTWRNAWNYVELHPEHMPVHVLRVEAPVFKPEREAAVNKSVH